MTILGLDETVVAPLIRAVAGGGLPPDSVAEYFARAAWTGIAEPGDRAAGALVGALGARTALTALVENWSARRLIERLADQGADDALGTELGEAVERWRPRLRSAPALIALKQAARLGVRLMTPADALWPPGLDDLGAHAPLALWLRGNDTVVAALERSVALVGARAATGYGEHVAMEASAGLVDRGYTIVSGAAYGIDGMAHRSALASSGRTVAFLAGGVDRFYPAGHDALLSRIVESGAVLSELPCGGQPTKWRFLQRNRLIAAASCATVVLEAGWRSGSLNTAGHAAALGRPLGAVPGPVTSAASAGCHRLLREFGATCVTSAEEMAELAGDRRLPGELLRDEGNGLSGDAANAERGRATPADHTRVLDALSSRSPRPAGEVGSRSGLGLAQVQTVLGVLHLEGRVREREDGWLKI